MSKREPGWTPESHLGKAWSAADDKLLREWTGTDAALSWKLKRTVLAIRMRRHKMKEQTRG